MQIFIRQADGRKITLEVEGQDTVANVKNKIYDKVCIPVEKQILTFPDSLKLSECQLKSEITLNLIVLDDKQKEAESNGCTVQ